MLDLGLGFQLVSIFLIRRAGGLQGFGGVGGFGGAGAGASPALAASSLPSRSRFFWQAWLSCVLRSLPQSGVEGMEGLKLAARVAPAPPPLSPLQQPQLSEFLLAESWR